MKNDGWTGYTNPNYLYLKNLSLFWALLLNLIVLVQKKVNQIDQENIQEDNKNSQIIKEKSTESDNVIHSFEKKDSTDDNISVASSITMDDIQENNEFTVVDNKKKKKKKPTNK